MRCDWTNCALKDTCFKLNKAVADELGKDLDTPVFCLADMFEEMLVFTIRKVVGDLKRRGGKQ